MWIKLDGKQIESNVIDRWSEVAFSLLFLLSEPITHHTRGHPYQFAAIK